MPVIKTKNTDTDMVALERVCRTYLTEQGMDPDNAEVMAHDLEFALAANDCAVGNGPLAPIVTRIMKRRAKGSNKDEGEMFTEQDFEDVLMMRRHIGTAAMAISLCGWTRKTVQNYMDRTPGAEAEWSDAYDYFTETLHAEAVNRARDGYNEPVFHEGKVTGYIKRKSDRILELMLRAHLPHLFRDNHAASLEKTAESAQFDLSTVSADTRLQVREHVQAIRDLIAADRATLVATATPPGRIEGARPSVIDGTATPK